MKKVQAIFMMLFVAMALKAGAQENSPLQLISTTPLPGFTGDFDHFGIDLKGGRLFLAAEDHKTVEVFDLHTGKRLHSITGFSQPHAIHYIPESNNLIVTDGDDFGMCELVSGDSYKILRTIKLPVGVDGAVYNPIDQYYYVESGPDDKSVKTHVLSIIDTRSFKHLGDITLPGNHSEAMALNHAGDKMYVNLTAVSQVGVVDLKTRQLIARWPVPDAHVQNSMALDEPNHRLFIATREPARFFVFDTDTGKVIATLPCAGFNDDMWFDAARKRIYVTGTETTTVIAQRDADHYEQIAAVPTGYRAKTSLFVPSLNRLYIAVSGKGKPGAKLSMQIYQVLP